MTTSGPVFPSGNPLRREPSATARSLRRLVYAIIAFALGLYIGAMLILSSRPDDQAAPTSTIEETPGPTPGPEIAPQSETRAE